MGRNKPSDRKRDTITKSKIARSPKTGIKIEALVKYLRLVLLFFAMAIVFYPPYITGLFFDKQLFFAEIFVFFVLAIFFIYKALCKGSIIIKTPLDYAAVLLIVVYLISMLVSVSIRAALVEWLKYCMYAAVFIMIVDLFNEFKTGKVLLWTITASASGVALLGIDGAAGGGLAGALNSFFSSLGTDIKFIGLFRDGRITSTLQYPNTLAVYLIAAIFLAIGLSVISNKLWQKYLAGVAAFIMMTAFIFTLSRGGYLVFAIIYLLFIILLPKGNRIKGVVNSLIPVAAAGVISLKLYSSITGTIASSSRIWLYSAVGAILVLVLITVAVYLIRWLESLSWKVYVGVFSIAVIICAAGLVFILNQTMPLHLDNSAGVKDELKTVTRTISLRPDREYKLVFDVEAVQTADQPYAYSILLQSQSKNDLIRAENYQEKKAGIPHNTQLGYLTGNSTNGAEEKTLSFKVPSDSIIVNISFSNLFMGTNVVFDKVYIEDESSGHIVKTLNMKYRYIPESLAQRLDSFFVNSSSMGRSTYYKDALKLIADRPLLGAGGGAWPLTYYSRQSFFYVVMFPHNYFLQVGVESGILGMLALIFLLLSIFCAFLLSRKFLTGADASERIMLTVLFVSIAALFGHSFIDFDFSYSAVFLLAWELTALINVQYRKIPEKYSFEFGNGVPGKFLSRVNRLSNLKNFRTRSALYILPLIVIMIISSLLLSGAANYKAAQKAVGEGRIDDALKLYKAAADSDPMDVDYRIDYANFLIKELGLDKGRKEADKQIESAIKYGINDPTKSQNIAAYYLKVGDNPKGLQFVNRGIELMPFNPAYWHLKVDVYNQISMLIYQHNGPEASKKSFDTTLGIIQQARAANARNMFPFKFIDETSAVMERAKYMKDHLDSKTKIRINDIIFNNYPEMDVDLDGSPDQWTFDKNAVDIKVNGDVMSSSSLAGNTEASIQSRKLFLSKDTTYRIEMELDKGGRKDVNYAIAGTAFGGILTDSGNRIYTADFSTPADFTAGNNQLILAFNGDVGIKSLKITEVAG